jgi:hypothetical protein
MAKSGEPKPEEPGVMSEELRTWYQELIERYNSKETIEAIVNLRHSFGVKIPDSTEQMALDPESAMQWARRVVTLEKKFKELVGGDLDTVPEEKLRIFQLDPVDVQSVKLSFIQFYGRLLMEVTIARDKEATPEAISLFKGGVVYLSNGCTRFSLNRQKTQENVPRKN